MPPVRDITSPLLTSVESVVPVKGRGTVAITTISKGIVKKLDKVEIIGFNEKLTSVVSDIQAFGRQIPMAKAGDHVG